MKHPAPPLNLPHTGGGTLIVPVVALLVDNEGDDDGWEITVLRVKPGETPADLAKFRYGKWLYALYPAHTFTYNRDKHLTIAQIMRWHRA